MEQRKGLRCKVCTGCGLCPGIQKTKDSSIQILTESLPDERESCEFDNPSMRLAVADIGTTTIAMQLLGRDGSCEESFVRLNPQSVYGADVLSRITHAEEAEKALEMQTMVRKVLEDGLRAFEGFLAAGETICLVIAANTTMNYLLAGFSPERLGRAPFLAEHLEPMELNFLEGRVKGFVFPGLSAFVGGDIVAGILACEIDRREEITLLIDLGTNGEMALGNNKRILATATAAGPAFEGGANRGVCGSDRIHLTHALLQEGILDETGLLQEPFFDKGVRAGNVLVTQPAIRSLQCAKAAIQAGIHILVKKYGISFAEVDRVVLAGGFGYFLNPADAAGIGLLPGDFLGKTVSGGNTALLGARMLGKRLLQKVPNPALKDWTALFQDQLCAQILNLAEEPGFAKSYTDAMALRASR